MIIFETSIWIFRWSYYGYFINSHYYWYFNITAQIREANQYHNLAIAEVEASDFDASIIAKYATGQVNNKIKTTFQNASVSYDTDQSYANERIYKVTTSYKITLPILGYERTNKIIGYAR